MERGERLYTLKDSVGTSSVAYRLAMKTDEEH